MIASLDGDDGSCRTVSQGDGCEVFIQGTQVGTDAHAIGFLKKIGKCAHLKGQGAVACLNAASFWENAVLPKIISP